MQSLSSTANTEQSTEYAFLKSFISLDTDHNDVITVNIAPNYGNTQFQHIQLKVLDGAIVVEPPCIREHSWPNGIKATVPVSTIRLYPRLFSPLAQVIGSVLAGQAGSFKDYVIIQDQELRAFNVQQSLHKASAKVRKAIPFG